MNNARRILTWIVTVLAVGGTGFGVVKAATDPAPGGVAVDHLRLNGYPPTSATLSVSLTGVGGLDVVGRVYLDMTNNEVEGTFTVPTLDQQQVEAIWANNRIYLQTSPGTSNPWVYVSKGSPSLFGLALEMTRPDLALVAGFPQESARTSGWSTVHRFSRPSLAVRDLFNPSVTRIGSMVWTVTTGSEGEVTASSVTLHTGTTTTSLTATVESYNQKVHITLPTNVVGTPLGAAQLRGLLPTSATLHLLVPVNISSLGGTSLT